MDNTGTVVQFISYEGSMTATDGVASGMTSSDIGVSESSTSAVGYSLQLAGTGTDYSAFSWQGSAAHTAGAINNGQSFGGSTPPVNQAPVAAFNVSCNDLDCNFDAAASSDADGSINAYSWTFGDGQSASGVTTAHSFASEGSYSVTLTVTDNQGATATSTQTVSVTAPVQSSGVYEINLNAAKRTWLNYSLDVPAGTTQLVVNMSGGSGDADLYVRFGSQPTTRKYDCRPYLTGNNESCVINNPAAGTWYMGIYGYEAFSGVTLEANAN